MQVAHIHQLPGPDKAMEAVEQLDSESKYLLIGLALVQLARDNGASDWYIYTNLRNPEPEDCTRILATLKKYGIATDLSFEDLRDSPHLACVCSGNYPQILSRFREAQKRLKTKTRSKGAAASGHHK